DFATLDLLQQRREAAHQLRRRRAAMRARVAHAQAAAAELEHRRERAPRVQAAVLHLEEKHDQARQQAAAFETDLVETGQELVNDKSNWHDLLARPTGASDNGAPMDKCRGDRDRVGESAWEK